MTTRRKISCRDANQLDLVDYLEKLGHQPQKINRNTFWYLSPLCKENTASFKVDRNINCWYDHGTGQGGTLIDFGILYHQCTVRDLLNKLTNEKRQAFPFQKQHLSSTHFEPAQKITSPIKIIGSGPINHLTILAYLEERKIPPTIANKYCEQVEFELYQKRQLAIGFKNENGGYELRNSNYKGSSSPKQPKLLQGQNANTIIVFEGFLSFLSYKTLEQNSIQKKVHLPNQQQACMILNSLAFFEKSRTKMELYQNIHLFLDRDQAGIAATRKALQWSPKYKDMSHLYKQHKDLNEFLVNAKSPTLKQRQGKSYRL